MKIGITAFQNGFALSLALSHGEREQIAGNYSNGRTLVIRFPLSVGEGANCRESKQWSDFSHLIPSPRGRGLGRGPQQSNPPDIPHSARRKVVAWALPAKTWKPSYRSPSFPQTSSVGKAHATASVQNPRCFQTTFRIKGSSETCKPALLPFWIQVKLTTRHDRNS